jgi:hypothetical protein
MKRPTHTALQELDMARVSRFITKRLAEAGAEKPSIDALIDEYARVAAGRA